MVPPIAPAVDVTGASGPPINPAVAPPTAPTPALAAAVPLTSSLKNTEPACVLIELANKPGNTVGFS